MTRRSSGGDAVSEQHSDRVGGVGLPVLVLFFLSGACGLVYQVAWARMLVHIFGSTSVAVGTVLGAFMSGLAAGSWLIGRVADRHSHPLRLYAWLEFGAAGTALGAHALLGFVTPLYLGLYGVLGDWETALGFARFGMAFGIVMVPTMLMGATLPVLTRFFVRDTATSGARLSTLYATNTFGGVAGTLLTGFFLIGAVGLNRSVLIAALGNVIAGGAAWMFAARAAPTPVSAMPDRPMATNQTSEPSDLSDRAHRLLLLGLAISGLTSFAYEIYWTRALVFFVGNSTYAVTMMLTAFLTGIGFGGFLARFAVDRTRDRLALFGWTQVLIAATSAASLPLLFAIAGPQAIRGFLGVNWDQAGTLMLMRFGLSAAVMLVPATLIGATFPIAARIGVRSLDRTGASVGRTYAVNTVGNVAGALLPGAVLIPWLGIVKGIQFMAVLNAVVGVAALGSRLRNPLFRWAAPVATSAALFALIQAPVPFRFPSAGESPRHELLFYREGPSATTGVIFDPNTGEKSMSIDGVGIGGTSFTDYKQQLLAHIPKLLVDDVSSELSIGVGSAILVGESARHSGVRELVAVEIEPSVVEGAALFAKENHAVLEDSRLRVVVDDVANFLRTTPKTFRIISSDEKTAQEYASNGFSYSTEYYDLLRERLAPGGVVAQWVPTSLPHSQYRMILRSFSESFPRAQLWYFPPAFQISTYNTLLVGSHDDVNLGRHAVQRRLQAGGDSFAGLTRYGLNTAEAVLVHLVGEGPAVLRAVADAPLNTLNDPRYEFYSPREFAVHRSIRLAENLDLIEEIRESAAQQNLERVGGEGPTARLEEALEAERTFTTAYRRSLEGPPYDRTSRGFSKAIEQASWNENLRSQIFVRYFEMSDGYVNARNPRAAAALLRRGLAADASSATGQLALSRLLRRTGAPDQAVVHAREAIELDPDLIVARGELAVVLLDLGQRDAAVEQLQTLLKTNPGDRAATELLDRIRAATAGGGKDARLR
jgi:spermidine synthase